MKAVYNPVTGKYYAIRQRTTKSGKKRQIKGLWKKPKGYTKKSLLDIIFVLEMFSYAFLSKEVKNEK